MRWVRPWGELFPHSRFLLCGSRSTSTSITALALPLPCLLLSTAGGVQLGIQSLLHSFSASWEPLDRQIARAGNHSWDSVVHLEVEGPPQCGEGVETQRSCAWWGRSVQSWGPALGCPFPTDVSQD